MVLYSASLFSYSVHRPSVIIQRYDLIAHLGVRESNVYPSLSSSRAQNSRASSWILLGCSTSISNSICPKVHLSFTAALLLSITANTLLLLLKPVLLRLQGQWMASSFIHLPNQSQLQVILHDSVILQIQPTLLSSHTLQSLYFPSSFGSHSFLHPTAIVLV